MTKSTLISACEVPVEEVGKRRFRFEGFIYGMKYRANIKLSVDDPTDYCCFKAFTVERSFENMWRRLTPMLIPASVNMWHHESRRPDGTLCPN